MEHGGARTGAVAARRRVAIAMEVLLETGQVEAVVSTLLAGVCGQVVADQSADGHCDVDGDGVGGGEPDAGCFDEW